MAGRFALLALSATLRAGGCPSVASGRGGRKNYSNRPYAKSGVSYETYRPAYEYGWQARMMHADADWAEIEPNLRAGWPQARGDSKLEWTDAQHAAKDAWDRVGPPIGSSKKH